MKNLLTILFAISFNVILFAQNGSNGEIPFKMVGLNSPKFAEAVTKAADVCVIPHGIIERHGPHLQIGRDLFEAWETAFTATKNECAVVYPPYYFGQIFETGISRAQWHTAHYQIC
jgi:creatinine amidohydrolase